MTPEQKEQLEQESALAHMGKQVLDNKAYQEFFIARKAQIFDLFCKTKQDQSDVREECWRTMVNMHALEEYFRISLETGKMANISLKSIQEE